MFYTGVMGTTRESRGSTPPKHKVVCLTKYIPFKGISHAGGEYLQAHLAVLENLATVELIAPATPHNMSALPKIDAPRNAALLTQAQPKLRGLLFKWFQVEATLAGCTMYWPIRRLFRSGRAPWAQLESADAIELQWSEMIGLAPLIRRRLPAKPLIGVAHDINTQRWQRQTREERSWLRRRLSTLIAKRTRAQESHSFSALTTLIVFSDKDAELARQLAPSVNVEVVHPGFTSKASERTPDNANPIVLFVGAMNRPENWGAALWFLEAIWPAVHAENSTARFVAAGAHPPKQLVDAMRKAPNTELTGFVDSLEPWYSQASVCVVPLRTGAGVKFKTIDAMISGVPVVTTSVGAEGIDADELFVALTDNSSEFADAIVNELKQPDQHRTAKAQAWAESVYGHAAFVSRLQEVYEHVWSE